MRRQAVKLITTEQIHIDNCIYGVTIVIMAYDPSSRWMESIDFTRFSLWSIVLAFSLAQLLVGQKWLLEPTAVIVMVALAGTQGIRWAAYLFLPTVLLLLGKSLLLGIYSPAFLGIIMGLSCMGIYLLRSELEQNSIPRLVPFAVILFLGALG